MSDQLDLPAPSSNDPFGSTRWSVVLAAKENGSRAREALTTLCEAYWLPVYGYVHSRCRRSDDAHDLTQEFFADLLERNALAAANAERGKFRAFLLTALKNFLINQRIRDTAEKRGGGAVILSLHHDVAVKQLSATATPGRSPEQEFERRWALALLERVLERLAAEQVVAGRAMEFQALRPFLTAQQEGQSQEAVAGTLGTTPAAVRAAVYRLRKRFRTLLRDEVAQTVETAGEVDEELLRLIAAVSS